MCAQVVKDFYNLLRNVDSFSAGQAKITDYKDDLELLVVEIIPSDGVYQHGKFEFEIVPKDYPQVAPEVHCQTRIYHPNIDLIEGCEDGLGGEICLNLFDEWNSSNDLQDCVQGLLFLLYNPNLEDPLNPMFSPSEYENFDEFVANVRRSLEGCEIDGYKFERNLACNGDCNHVMDVSTEGNILIDNVTELVEGKVEKEEGRSLGMQAKIESEAMWCMSDGTDEVISVAEKKQKEQKKVKNVNSVVCYDNFPNSMDSFDWNKTLTFNNWLYFALTLELAISMNMFCNGELGLVFLRAFKVCVRTKLEASILEIISKCHFNER